LYARRYDEARARLSYQTTSVISKAGTYRIEAREPGLYLLHAVSQYGTTPPCWMRLGAGSEQVRDFELGAAVLSFVVSDAATGKPTPGAGPPPGPAEARADVLTRVGDDQGRIRFDALAPGAYPASIFAPAPASRQLDDQAARPAGAGASTSGDADEPIAVQL